MMALCSKLIEMGETHRMPERDLGYARKVFEWGNKKKLKKKEDPNQEKR